MAKAGAAYRFVREAIKQLLLEFVKVWWPLAIPVVAAITQLYAQVPAPYFWTAFAVAVAASIYAVNQLRILVNARTIENKVHLALISLEQARMAIPVRSGACMYRLIFQVISIHEKFLFMKLEQLVWEIGESRPKSRVEVEEDAGILVPEQPIYIHSPTLEGIDPAFHSGKYAIKVHYGRTQDEMEFEIAMKGTFKVMAASEEPSTESVPFRGHVMSYSVKRIRP